MRTKLIEIAYRFCYCSNKNKDTEHRPEQRNPKLKKKNSRKIFNFSAFLESSNVKNMSNKKPGLNVVENIHVTNSMERIFSAV